jgi:hypothetical protein
MKKLFFMLIAVAFAGVAVKANEGTIPDYKVRNWTATQKFRSIEVSGDISVVLIEDNASVVSVQGKTKMVDMAKIEVKDGVLHVYGKRGPWRNRTVVYIPVQQLSRITVKGASEIASMGVLNSDHLHIRIEGTCKVSVKNKGLVTVDNDDDYEVSYEKIQKIKISGNAAL